jgi:hypothetical protein
MLRGRRVLLEPASKELRFADGELEPKIELDLASSKALRIRVVFEQGSFRWRRGTAGAVRPCRPHQCAGRGRGECGMKDVLADICTEKRAHVARAKAVLSENALLASLAGAPPPRPFAARLDTSPRTLWSDRRDQKASPSAG